MAKAWIPVVLVAAACSGPPRGDCDPNPGPGAVGSICGFENPEDVEVVREAAILLVSEMRFAGRKGGGAVAAIALDDGGRRPRRLWPPEERLDREHTAEGDPSCVSPPETLSPHGITSASGPESGVVRVAVVGHDEREAVELFDLTGAGSEARLSWRGCVPLPPETSGNDVAVAPDGEIVVSNFQPEPPTTPSLAGLLSTLGAVIAGRPTGDLIVWKRDRGWRHIPGTQAAMPNGVAVSRDGSAIYYAETAAARVLRVPREGISVGEPDRVEIGGSPDNLSWTSRRTLLAATHDPSAEFMPCALGRSPCRSAWAVFEIDPATLQAKEILRHDGEVVGAVASAAESGDRYFFGSVYDDRIGVWTAEIGRP